MKPYHPQEIEKKRPHKSAPGSASGGRPGKQKTYRPWEIEPKWQRHWRKEGVYEVDLDKAQKPFFNLMMFPYPSGEGLHVGNMYAFTGSDIYGRFKRMQGFDVFEPIGLDGFGIHSENYALKLGKHPADVAKETEKNFYRQLEAAGNGYAWSNILETYDPDYYRWTQWIFIQLFKAGLAERKKAPVNWCPSCKTTLSDEQVIAGQCERCKTEVEKRELEQWFFKITQYADKLLKNLDWINWSERTKIAQRNWIGKSEGAEIKFPIVDSKKDIPSFTTRPDTIFGATFFVLAPESEWVKKLTKPRYQKKVTDYLRQARRKTEVERLFTEREKTGVFTGSYVVNPATNKKIPVWVADYVVMGYGTGAIMGVPAHDQRDWEFAKKYQLPIKRVIMENTSDGGRLNPPAGGRSHNSSEAKKKAFEDYGILVNSGQFNGLSVKEGIKKITAWLIKKGLAKKQVQYRLRDWCISRQRYWGPPIPMIDCPKCGWQPVSEKDLPVKLPYIKNYQPKGVGKSPLAQAKSWVKVKCPQCGGSAERETDVSDTFLDSAWYFFRYPSTDFNDKPFDKRRTGKWLPVEMYIGGQEHALLHLMYTRFLTMAFKDLGLIDFEEPFKRFYAHGLIIKDGAKMSKSRGNVVIPDKYIGKFGADTLRTYLMFFGPFDQGGDFQDQGIAGMYRFFNRVWRIAQKFEEKGSQEEKKIIHQTIKKVTDDILGLRYNTAIAAIMEMVNFLYKEKTVSREAIEKLTLLLAPFAPHITEELWCGVLGNHPNKHDKGDKVSPCQSHKVSVHLQPWPKYDPKLAREEKMTVVVQVNGKVRSQIRLSTPDSKLQAKVEKVAKKEANVAKHLKGKKVKKTIFVPSRLINFVV